MVGETALHVACKKGDVAKVTELLEAHQNDLSPLLNARDHNGWTALHEACGGGHVEVVKKLLEAGVVEKLDLFVVGGDDALTPLEDAVQAGNLEVARLFLQTAKSRGNGTDFPTISSLLKLETALPSPALKEITNTKARVSASNSGLAKLASTQDMKSLITEFAQLTTRSTFIPSLPQYVLISRYLAVSCGQFTMQEMKKGSKMTGDSPRFSGMSNNVFGRGEAEENRGMIEIVRGETGQSSDTRTVNDLKTFKLEQGLTFPLLTCLAHTR